MFLFYTVNTRKDSWHTHLKSNKYKECCQACFFCQFTYQMIDMLYKTGENLLIALPDPVEVESCL